MKVSPPLGIVACKYWPPSGNCPEEKFATIWSTGCFWRMSVCRSINIRKVQCDVIFEQKNSRLVVGISRREFIILCLYTWSKCLLSAVLYVSWRVDSMSAEHKQTSAHDSTLVHDKRCLLHGAPCRKVAIRRAHEQKSTHLLRLVY
jgi:hypothetical protein